MDRGTSPFDRISSHNSELFSNFPDSVNYNNSEYGNFFFMDHSFENLKTDLDKRVQKIENLLNLIHLNKEEKE